MERQAQFSKNRKFRYTLSRRWAKGPMLLFIMHNPSTANENKEDPTLRRIINFSKSWGYGGLYVGNLFPYCSAVPLQNFKISAYVQRKNKGAIMDMNKKAEKTVFAWGNNINPPVWIMKYIRNPYCIDRSKIGVPKHPLFLKKTLTLSLYVKEIN